MNLSAPFIARSRATTLLTIGIVLAGLSAFRILPVAPLPQVDFPTILVQASLPGASPETMATSVATPLERALGRIAGINEMTSNSSLGQTRVTLQFDLNRNIDGAARDVQAAINAARTLLPSGLPSNPTYRKANPADAPVMIMALTSDTMTQGQLYDAASTILAQKLSQVEGIGQVTVGGSSLPAVRIELNLHQLDKYGLGLETARAAIAATNPNRPKGAIESGDTRWQIQANDQANRAKDYLPLILGYYNNAPIRVQDVGTAVDSVQDLRNAGLSNGRLAVLIIITKQPGANIIETVDRVNAMMPELRRSIPRAINLDVIMDRTPTIRGSLHDTEMTLALSIILVTLVVFAFLRSPRATFIPAISVPVSLIGTFGVMYLFDYSLDNLSLMALTIATGFVVDDAIVVLENISRHMEEKGLSPLRAAYEGAREVGFTVLSMSLSLVAVFIPILLMGGMIGRLFREFAVTLSAAIMVSLVVSLTLTPMLCARVLRHEEKDAPHGRLYRFSENLFLRMQRFYERTLAWALRHGKLMMLMLLLTVCCNVYLYVVVPKGFFPQVDSGRLQGAIQADQSISFQAMQKKLGDFMRIVMKDDAVQNVVGFTGGQQRNTGNMFIALKPLEERNLNADQVIARLRGKLAHVPGAKLFLQSSQDIRMGGRMGNAQYQYTLQSDDLAQLRIWATKLYHALQEEKTLADVNSDQQDAGIQTSLVYDRDSMSRLGITPALADATLNDAFGQRQVSTIYNPLNQYHVVMEGDPSYWQYADSLETTYVATSGGGMTPFPTFSHVARTSTPLAVNHQGQFAAATISFNLPNGASLGDAAKVIEDVSRKIGMPDNVIGSFQGTAKLFKESFSSQGVLILTALATIYIVLGMLYESWIHPITILSTLPSAGVGALLALLLFKMDFTLIALIGVILLIGIVKKNAILMIDFAIERERKENIPPEEAIFEACALRFRPIMMTTMAALFGALPLAIGAGNGAELRQPLGVSIMGGLILSQLLTLYTTPVVYLYLDDFRLWWNAKLAKRGGPKIENPGRI